MTTFRPLEYESLKCVTKFLGFKRLLLSHRCPSIRNVEMMVALIIKSFHIEPTQIKIDESTFKIGIIRHYKNEENPQFIQRENMSGGVPYDVDRYGFPDKSDNAQISYKRDKNLESIKYPKKTLLKLQQKRAAIASAPNKTDSLEQVENEINDCQKQIQMFNLRRYNTEPPYTHFIQVTFPETSGFKTEILDYSKRKLPEAMQYLAGKLLCGNKRNLQVDFFEIDPGFGLWKKARKFTLLPLGSKKLRVRKLKMLKDVEKLTFLTPILTDDSFPLVSVEIDRVPNKDHLVIDTAQTLIFFELILFEKHVLQVSHHRVYIKKPLFINGPDFVEILRDWRGPVGKRCSIECRDQERANGWLFKSKEVHGARIVKNSKEKHHQYVILPLNERSELKIYLERIQAVPEYVNDDGVRYLLNLESQPVGMF